MAETQLSISIEFEARGRIGPGRIGLLEAIRKTGSIMAAAKSMQMSYRAAWLHVDELNKLLARPVVTTLIGGRHGGATLTPTGEKIIALYHSIEGRTRTAGRAELLAFQKLYAKSVKTSGAPS